MNENITTGLKISEMIDEINLTLQAQVPILSDDLNKKITLEKIINELDFIKVTSDLLSKDKTLATSAFASNILYTSIQTIQNDLMNLNLNIVEIESNISNIISILNDVDSFQADWNNDDPNSRSYIRNKPDVIIGPQGPQGIQGLQGLQGVAGRDGIDGKDGIDGAPGLPGENGKTTYFHIKYSVNPTGNPMTNIPSKYIGTVVTESPYPPSDYTVYKWFDWKGAQGADGQQGIPGESGVDGKTSYLHIKFGTGYDEVTGIMKFTTNNGEDPGDWMGTYVDFNILDSMDPTKYTWVYTKGTAGDQGPMTVFMGNYDSATTYTGGINLRHIVRYNAGNGTHYYITLKTAGNFSNIPPSNTTKWALFEAEFKSIATEFLFAEGANIAGWVFSLDANNNEYLRSQSQHNGIPNIVLNGAGGEITVNGSNEYTTSLATSTYGIDSGSFVEAGLYSTIGANNSSKFTHGDMDMRTGGAIGSGEDFTKIHLGTLRERSWHGAGANTYIPGIHYESFRNNKYANFSAGTIGDTGGGIVWNGGTPGGLAVCLNGLPTSDTNIFQGQVYVTADGTLKIKL